MRYHATLISLLLVFITCAALELPMIKRATWENPIEGIHHELPAPGDWGFIDCGKTHMGKKCGMQWSLRMTEFVRIVRQFCHRFDEEKDRIIWGFNKIHGLYNCTLMQGEPGVIDMWAVRLQPDKAYLGYKECYESFISPMEYGPQSCRGRESDFTGGIFMSRQQNVFSSEVRIWYHDVDC